MKQLILMQYGLSKWFTFGRKPAKGNALGRALVEVCKYFFRELLLRQNNLWVKNDLVRDVIEMAETNFLKRQFTLSF